MFRRRKNLQKQPECESSSAPELGQHPPAKPDGKDDDDRVSDDSDAGVSLALARRRQLARANKSRYNGLSSKPRTPALEPDATKQTQESKSIASNGVKPIYERFTRASIQENVPENVAEVAEDKQPPAESVKPGKQKVNVSRLIHEISAQSLPNDHPKPAAADHEHKVTQPNTSKVVKRVPKRASAAATRSPPDTDLDSKVDALLTGSYVRNPFHFDPMKATANGPGGGSGSGRSYQGPSREKVLALHARLEQSIRMSGNGNRRQLLSRKSAKK